MQADASSRIASDLLTIDELASELGVARRTVERWHAVRIGPPRIRVGRKVYYRAAAVRMWLEAHEQAEPRAARA